MGLNETENRPLLQDLLQALVLVLHAHLLVEFQGWGVPAPDMERDVVEALGAGVVQGVVVELFADVFSACGFVYAQVVDVQGTDAGAERAFFDFL